MEPTETPQRKLNVNTEKLAKLTLGETSRAIVQKADGVDKPVRARNKELNDLKLIWDDDHGVR